MVWHELWSRGPCEGCGAVDDHYRGRCLPCRQPEDRREIVAYGVPPGSADNLAWLMKRAGESPETVLRTAHPRLMENIVVIAGTLRILDKKYCWMRNVGWTRLRPS